MKGNNEIFSYSGEYGIGLSWNFPFSREYWKSTSLKRKISDETLKSFSNRLKTKSHSQENHLIVQIKSLRKFFPRTNRTVLKNISFNLYSNELTSLIGHNGAGHQLLCFFPSFANEISFQFLDKHSNSSEEKILFSFRIFFIESRICREIIQMIRLSLSLSRLLHLTFIESKLKSRTSNESIR